MAQHRRVSPAKLEEARKKAGYNSQAAAARDLEWSRSRLNNYERGRPVPLRSLDLMAQLYGVTLDSLLN